MQAVAGVIGLAPSQVVPRGLGTGQLESFTGYVARISARIAVPTVAFVRRALQDSQPAVAVKSISAVNAGARRLNVGDRATEVTAAVERLTGHPHLCRLSFFAFAELFGVGERGLLARRRRWCSQCWRDDGEEPYERKVWWLGLVDACHVHQCFLESRCHMCGRLQPTLPRAVRRVAPVIAPKYRSSRFRSGWATAACSW